MGVDRVSSRRRFPTTSGAAVAGVWLAGCSNSADNPGQRMLHCHNTYHLEAGMATTFAYLG